MASISTAAWQLGPLVSARQEPGTYYLQVTQRRKPRGPLVVVARDATRAIVVSANLVKYWRKAFRFINRGPYSRKDYSTPQGGAKINYMELFECFYGMGVRLGKYRRLNIAHMRETRLNQPSIKPRIP